MPKLTEQQKKFCQNYILTFDAGRSAIEAGYSPKSAPSQGSKLIRKPQCSAYINQLSSEIEERTTVEAGQIIAELSKIAFASPEKKVSNADRVSALKLLGQTLAMFTESHAFETNRIEPIAVTAEQKEDFLEMTELMEKARAKGLTLKQYIESRPRLSG